MPSEQQIPIKFVKSLLASGSADFTPTQSSRFFEKLLYEFWGFCVNGGTSLTQPGGLVAVSYPANFQSGSTVLLAQGNDGTTSFGTDVFSSPSTNFLNVNSGSLIGKYLVTWVPGSDSTDDSVYFIKSVEDATHIRVDINSGGTRRLGNHSCFWDRNNVKWRVVDLIASTKLSGSWNASYMVLNMVSAPSINPGQLVPQLQVMHLTESGGDYQGSEGGIGLVISPSGSWNGSTFTDPTPQLTGSVSYYTGFGTPGSVTNGQVNYTLIGAGDFIIAHVKGFPGGTQANLAGTGFHVEVPKRLYPQANDPNPIAWLLWDNQTPSQVASTYYDGFRMVCRDGQVRRWTVLVRSPMGTGNRADYTGNAYGTGQWQQFSVPAWRFTNIGYDQDDDQFLASDGVLSLSLSSQFSAGRARLRKVKFSSAELPTGARLGDPILENRGWVHMINGILLPWDNSSQPERPWRFGV
jgi:hypothetical protein